MKLYEVRIFGVVIIMARRRVWDSVKNFLRLKTTIARDRKEAQILVCRTDWR
jgi:hypothetical protein